jgi:hypothetical protein
LQINYPTTQDTHFIAKGARGDPTHHQDAHEEFGHGSGVEQVLTLLGSRFWIVKERRAVRNIVESCSQCRRRFSVKTAEQKMAPLLRPRLQSLRAFERVGVYYGGPFLTKEGRCKAKAKRYLCLFTCLATRTVHLEMSYFIHQCFYANGIEEGDARIFYISQWDQFRGRIAGHERISSINLLTGNSILHRPLILEWFSRL